MLTEMQKANIKAEVIEVALFAMITQLKYEVEAGRTKDEFRDFVLDISLKMAEYLEQALIVKTSEGDAYDGRFMRFLEDFHKQLHVVFDRYKQIHNDKTDISDCH